MGAPRPGCHGRFPTSAGIENDDAVAGLTQSITATTTTAWGDALHRDEPRHPAADSPEQRTAVEKIRTELHARMEAADAAERNLEATLGDGVAAASIDTAKVDADVAQLTAATASRS